MVDFVFTGAMFCYGVFTLQRKNFLFDKLPILWKKFPKKFHEPLFECGVCVSSFWGIIFTISQYFIHEYIDKRYILLANIPFYIIAMCGICAVVDRAVKFFENGYGYNKPK